ncbi:ATP-dependent helicase, partial [Streptomyces sp. PSKA30]|nr:ATP-dependent helicase [Streptomyces sp. PSKA30]
MSRARTKRTYDRFGGSATNRSSGAPRRSKSSKGSKGYGGRQSAPQGDFALPVTTTPALPAVESFADLALPAPLLTTLGQEGVTVPFPIQAATLPNSLAG